MKTALGSPWPVVQDGLELILDGLGHLPIARAGVHLKQFPRCSLRTRWRRP